MANDITVYEKRSCSTCRTLFELLTERGVDFERVHYHIEGIGEQRIRSCCSARSSSVATGPCSPALDPTLPDRVAAHVPPGLGAW